MKPLEFKEKMYALLMRAAQNELEPSVVLSELGDAYACLAHCGGVSKEDALKEIADLYDDNVVIGHEMERERGVHGRNGCSDPSLRRRR